MLGGRQLRAYACPQLQASLRCSKPGGFLSEAPTCPRLGLWMSVESTFISVYSQVCLEMRRAS